ncbi:glycosyltransferase [Methylorubrum extorquens]
MTEEVAGINRSGGIGTCTRGLSEYLAFIGYAVEIIITDTSFQSNTKSINSGRISVTSISSIIAKDTTIKTAIDHAAISLYIYRYVKSKGYDVVHFNDWRGSGFHTAAAKRQGLIDSVVVSNLHGSSEWVRQYNQTVPSINDMELEAIERSQIENSDIVISPSKYLIDYYRNKGIAIRDSRVINWILPQWVSKTFRENESLHTPPINRGAIKNIIFLGRQERRKGIEIFIDAVSKLPPDKQPNLKFVGSFSRINGEFTGSYILRKLSAYNGSIVFLHDIHQVGIHELLADADQSLCVMPSLIENSPCVIGECFTSGIPFIACNVGGVSELLKDSHIETCLVPPAAMELSKKIADIIELGLGSVESSLQPLEIMKSWADFHFDIINRKYIQANLQYTHSRPKVSICVVHYERPHLLRIAVEAISRQTYKEFEVIVVDDGSVSREAIDYLSELSNYEREFTLTVIRSENQYLGAARNLAASYAVGDYIIFHDDDNYLEPDAVEIFVTAIMSSGADVLTSQYYAFEEVSTERKPPERAIMFAHIGIGGLFSYFSNRFGDANSIINKKVFFDIGGFSKERNIGFEDWEFFLKAYLSGYKIGNIPEPLFNYRISLSGMLMTGNVYNDYGRVINLVASMNVPITRDLLEIAMREDLENHIRSRVMQQARGDEFEDLYKTINQLVPGSKEQLSKLADYAFSMGRAFDGLKILLNSRLLSNYHDDSVSYSDSLNNLRNINKLTIQPSSEFTNEAYLMLIGWISQEPADIAECNFYIDNDCYVVKSLVRRPRDDAAKHLGLESENNKLGFIALLQKKRNKIAKFNYFEKKINLGLGSDVSCRRIYIKTTSLSTSGHIDNAYQVCFIPLQRYISSGTQLLEVRTPSEFPVTCLVDKDGTLEFGFPSADGRSIFLSTMFPIHEASIVISIGSSAEIIARTVL